MAMANKIDIVYPDCPCKGCEDRTSNCHSTCKAYKKYKNDISEAKERVREWNKACDWECERTQRINKLYYSKYRRRKGGN